MSHIDLGPFGEKITRRQYLMFSALEMEGSTYLMAIEAVATTALAHPDWNMDERQTWEEWDLHFGHGRRKGPRDRQEKKKAKKT